MTLTPSEVFHKLVWGVAEGRWDELPELYADETLVEHPFAPAGDKPMRTREELREHFSAGKSLPPLRQEPANITVHETTDPEVIIAEFEYRGTTGSGESFRVPCIFVLRVRDGEIIASHDYIDHISSARRRGALNELLDGIRT
ncbi:nuclear transport factor 2 family protein [Actinomadura sp. NEAU-AAG7]|uniref:nuclear transport factor 2 family protein n=1 Tax=Actinomadura sp. NEAU-AAG7 TaxID=2839640 RepID=UPI001BE3E120|nr:nuclear transport factor 2 family protein [Actinomadura sp. NEAU-AAG7]MBT2210054.1 nuclear transport factor 2 family protein [Actinomadura sp. NEAU-AAG7]